MYDIIPVFSKMKNNPIIKQHMNYTMPIDFVDELVLTLTDKEIIDSVIYNLKFINEKKLTELQLSKDFIVKLKSPTENSYHSESINEYRIYSK